MMLMCSRRRACLALAGCFSCSVAVGHHSFYASYLLGKDIHIEGDVIQVIFRNPHSFIQVLAPDSQGHMQRWAVEWAGAGALAHTRVSYDTLKPGDRVTIVGSPGRNPADHLLILHSIERPADGWKWNLPFQ